MSPFAAMLTSVGWWNGPAAVADAVDDRDAATGDVRVVDGLADLLRVAGVRRLVARADAQQVPAVLVELRDEVRDRLDEVGVVVGRDADAVRVLKDLLAPVVDELAALVEDHERVLRAREDVDVVLRVAGDAGALAPLPALRQLTPALDQLVLTLTHIDVPGVDCHVLIPPLFRATSLRRYAAKERKGELRGHPSDSPAGGCCLLHLRSKSWQKARCLLHFGAPQLWVKTRG